MSKLRLQLFRLALSAAWIAALVAPALAAGSEPAGPSSRRTGLVISEIMYHPLNPPGVTNNLEFVELANAGEIFEELAGYQFDGDISFSFPTGLVLQVGSFLVVAKDPDAVMSVYGITNVLGPYTGSLPGNHGTVRLLDELRARLLEVNYQSDGEWPVAADGAGHSLVLQRSSYGEGDARAWGASDLIGGSPGTNDAPGAEPLRSVVINEFLAHTDLPFVDFSELYNASTNAVDLSGAWLSDEPDTNKFRIPDGTVLGPRGFISFDETQLGFSLRAAGDEIFLVNSNQTRVLDAVRFGGQAPNTARGRSPDGAPYWSELAVPTPGVTNGARLLRDVVLNEIMYHPISEASDDEFIELHNRGTNNVSLAGWRISDGVSFTFPSNAVIAPGGFVVAAASLTNLLAKYTNLTTANTFGNWSGSLKNGGERLALEMPEEIVSTNGVTNVAHVLVGEVRYHDGGRWGKWSDGGGSSLELMDPRADPRFADNWADSDESAKAPWTTVEYVGVLDNGMTLSNGVPDRVEFFLQGAGESLVDDVECFQNAGVNRLANPGFELGTFQWTFNGTQRGSYVQVGGGVTGNALHLVATGRGDAGPNKVSTPITKLTAPGYGGGLRAKVRWLKGDPYFLLRTRGHWMEAVARLTVPPNLGTPGRPNSRFVTNAGPALVEVVHAPLLPGAGQPVIVTARVNDPDGVGPVTLRYRVDPATTFTDLVMRDDGGGGDALAGDGIFSATLPGQASGTLVAFHVAATDAASPAATNQFPADAPAHECLVRWGEPAWPGSLMAYRVWLTAANLEFWVTRARDANDPIDCTFVLGGARVIYNARTLYSGSPFHTSYYNGPLGNLCDYVLNFPANDKFLGAEDFVLAAQDPTQADFFFRPDRTSQAEQAAMWVARKLGLEHLRRRPCQLFLNGQRRGALYEDAQQPNGDTLAEYFPGDNAARLHKIEDWFEFNSANTKFNYVDATLQRFDTTNGVDGARYRWNWRPRAGTDPDDFTPLITLVTAANTAGTGPDYTSNVLAQVNIRGWLRPIALRHLVGDWDGYGYERGKNFYALRRGVSPWQLILWDLDFAFNLPSGRPPDSDMFSCADPVLAKMLGHPPFRREYFGAMLDAVNGPLVPGAADPALDARYSLFQANGITTDSPAAIKDYIAQRRAYLLTQIPTAPFTATGPVTSLVATVTLSGLAPVNVATISVNGQPLAPDWGTVTNWSAPFLLRTGSNSLALEARDAVGALVGSAALNIFFTGVNAWPGVRINEWMASNTGFIRDPADNDTDDWIELFNPTAAAVDLGGWYLTDTLTNLFQFPIPAGYAIAPGGYLLVWADGEPDQNATNRPDLHVNFQLSKSGEAIGLTAPDGTLVDSVSFGAQSNNVSLGRYPDGTTNFYFMVTPTPRSNNIFLPPAPRLTSLAFTNSAAAVAFTTLPGIAYRLDFKNDPAATNWTPLGTNVLALGTNTTLNDPGATNALRLYRAVAAP